MSQIEKLLARFWKDLEKVRYRDMEKILQHFGFEKITAKGSHVKFKHNDRVSDIVIPVHHNECKPFYKKQVRNQISNLKK